MARWMEPGQHRVVKPVRTIADLSKWENIRAEDEVKRPTSPHQGVRMAGLWVK